jgi:hypothetical protein
VSGAAFLAWTDASGKYLSLVFDVVKDEQWGLSSKITKHPVEVGAAVTDNIRRQPRKVTLKVVATNEPLGTNQWSSASMQSAGPLTMPSVSFKPGPGVIDALDWDNKLMLRVLAGTAGGLVGNAIGGSAGGAIGAAAGSLVAGALFQGELVHRKLHTNAGQPQPPGAVVGPVPPINPKVVTFDTPDDFVLRTIQLLETLHDTGQTIDVYGTKSSCIGPGAPSGIGGMGIASVDQDRNKETGTGADIVITLEEIRVVATTTVPAPKPTDSQPSVAKGNQQTFDMEADANAQNTADDASPFMQGVADGSADVAGAILSP